VGNLLSSRHDVRYILAANQLESEPLYRNDGGDIHSRNVGSYIEAHGIFIPLKKEFSKIANNNLTERQPEHRTG
jgi:hypothetical protein